jgi:flagellar motor switch protein FliN/FliY
MTQNTNQPDLDTGQDQVTLAAEAALGRAATSDQDPTTATLSTVPPVSEMVEDSATPPGGGNLSVVLDIPVKLALELGRTRLTVRELLQLGEGSVVKLDRPPGEPLDIYVNDCLVARGEVVVVNDRFGMRITDIVSPEERLKRLR